MGRFDGKVVVVTGASSGVGRTVSIAFAREGARVACSDIRKAPMEKEPFLPGVHTDDYIRAQGGEALFVACDVTKLSDCQNMIKTVVEHYGRLDVIFNNAGVFTTINRIHAYSEWDWDFTMGVNGKGIYNCCHAAITQFLAQGGGGVIINMCSIGGLTGLKGESAYVASKHAAVGLTRQLAVDYGPDGIRVNGLCPSYMPTQMCVDFFSDADFCAYFKGITPLGRLQTTEDLVGPILFLASDDSAYMTGQLLVIDGGITARIQ